MTETRAPSFATVVLDVDSTVSSVEGIDWLAARRGPDVAESIRELTAQAMSGEIPLETVYGRRLEAIRPSRDEVDALSNAYIDALASGCAETIDHLRGAGVHLVLVSGGIRNALLRLALHLDIPIVDVHGVDVYFHQDGTYVGFNDRSPLTTSTGKAAVIATLAAPRPLLMVGDGMTDLAARPSVDSFAAFTAFAARPPVVSAADAVVHSFAELERLVLGD